MTFRVMKLRGNQDVSNGDTEWKTVWAHDAERLSHTDLAEVLMHVDPVTVDRAMQLVTLRRGIDVEAPIGGEATEDEALAAALRDWWLGVAEDEVARCVPKAIEYGANDLVEIGRQLATVTGREDLLPDAEQLAELGIYFYLLGKVARWTDAVKTRRRVSDDTLHDIGVYVRMAQRVRAVGGWPFHPDDEGRPQAADAPEVRAGIPW